MSCSPARHGYWEPSMRLEVNWPRQMARDAPALRRTSSRTCDRRGCHFRISRNACSGSQLVEQGLGVFQVARVEALGEPTVDFGEHLARLAAAPLLVEQPSEAHRYAQFPRLGALAPSDIDSFAKRFFRLYDVCLMAPEQQFTPHPMKLRFRQPMVGSLHADQAFVGLS